LFGDIPKEVSVPETEETLTADALGRELSMAQVTGSVVVDVEVSSRIFPKEESPPPLQADKASRIADDVMTWTSRKLVFLRVWMTGNVLLKSFSTIIIYIYKVMK